MNLKQFKNSDFSSDPHLLLIGNPVGHSLSPLMHNTAAKYYNLPLQYYAVQVQSHEFGSLAAYLNNENLHGLNVTIPFKRLMLDYVDRLEQTSRNIGAINTIVKDDSQLIGYNTDAYGFCKPLRPYQSEIEGERAIVFGTGGAARAVVFGLIDLGFEEIILVSRNPQKVKDDEWPVHTLIISYDAWPEYASETALFVNATPLGMEPNKEKSPVQKDEFTLLGHAICYDLVYTPVSTAFLKGANSVNARTIGGLEMLIYQGSRAFKLWTGKTFPIDIVRNTLENHL